MTIKLTKPLALFDLETTGLNISSDRIIEISILKLLPDGGRENLTQRINPEIPVSEESFAIHGISNEDLKDEPAFAKIAKNLVNFIGNADLSGYNVVKFDLPMFVEELLRANVDFSLEGRKVIDVQHIFHKKERRDLAAAYQFYCDKEIENQHSAEADIMATEEVLQAQIERYEDIGDDMDSLYEFTGKQLENMVDLAGRIVLNEEGEAVFNFGKYKSRKVFDIFEKDPAYYGWIIKNDFPQHTKQKLTELMFKWKQLIK
ncbi:MAG: 3'-5' exonuclease [Bacteroidetes bacterium]|nr:3'-5' exonuclease [Bacteroidota bacterium]